MRPDQQIQINGLLLQREELFVRVHQIESAVHALLGESYPFTRPALPSDTRTKRKTAARAATAPRDPLRKLEGREVAYRVTYRSSGKTFTEEHDEVNALRTLFAAQGATLQITRLETIDLVGKPVAVVLEG